VIASFLTLFLLVLFPEQDVHPGLRDAVKLIDRNFAVKALQNLVLRLLPGVCWDV
jgi:hypothetical protein